MDADRVTAEGNQAGPFLPRSLISLLEDSTAAARVRAHETGASERVVVPKLSVGKFMLEHVPVKEECAIGEYYESVVPWMCEFNGAEVIGRCGTVCMGGEVVADTLPLRDAFIRENGRVKLGVNRVRPTLSGLTISLLHRFDHNYYHWTIESLGRLAAADAERVEAAENVLVPPLRSQYQRDGLTLAGLTGKRIIEMEPGDRIAIGRLLLPVNMADEWRPHPRLREFFQVLAESVTAPAGASPARVYVDRRHSEKRPLANEDEVISALSRYGFVPVRLENLSLAEQITLFRSASMVVAPHGAGLANILFARPGCVLIELQMNTYVHWMFRLFAAFLGVVYDCVIGVQSNGPTAPGGIHQQRWAVSVTHLLSAVEQALARPRHGS